MYLNRFLNAKIYKYLYLESRGKRDVSVDLPVTVTTFQEALSLSGGDFIATWDRLSAQGQEVQEVLSPSKPINPEEILAVLSSTLRYDI